MEQILQLAMRVQTTVLLWTPFPAFEKHILALNWLVFVDVGRTSDKVSMSVDASSDVVIVCVCTWRSLKPITQAPPSKWTKFDLEMY